MTTQEPATWKQQREQDAAQGPPTHQSRNLVCDNPKETLPVARVEHYDMHGHIYF